MTAPTPVAAADEELQRAHLQIIDPRTDPSLIPLRFNPAEYHVKKTQTFAEIAIPGLSSPPVQWVRGGAEVLSFDAVLDTTHTLEDVDDAYVATLRGLLDPDPKLHAPPIVAFVWGRRSFTGVLDGLDIAYQLFDQSGRPLRAKLGITLKEYRPVAVQLRQNRRSSATVEKTYLVRRGDSLITIASAVYADPARWRELALANGISDPRRVRPGQLLLVPRLQ